jgi:aryl-alcohol dehydrogenase-like predicted oxidoreductase
METRPIPGTELRVSVLALGGWLTLGERVPDDEALRILHAAADSGINFLDLADVYGKGGAERLVGRFLRERRRESLVISSKVFWPTSDDSRDRGLSRGHIHRSIDRTLARLGTDHVELYFCHREDPGTPLSETVQAMHDLVRAGKVRAWGTSNWRPQTLRAAHALARAHGLEPPRVEQPCYNLLERWIEREVLPTCAELGMAAVVWSPLAGGVLTGKYLDGVPAGSRGAVSRWVADYLQPEARERVRAFVALCGARGLRPETVALAWAMRQPGVTSAIGGATREAQLRGNLAAAQLVLDARLRERLDAIFPPLRRSRWRSALRRAARFVRPDKF